MSAPAKLTDEDEPWLDEPYRRPCRGIIPADEWADEVRWLRSFGFREELICERLGMRWQTYVRRLERVGLDLYPEASAAIRADIERWAALHVPFSAYDITGYLTGWHGVPGGILIGPALKSAERAGLIKRTEQRYAKAPLNGNNPLSEYIGVIDAPA